MEGDQNMYHVAGKYSINIIQMGHSVLYSRASNIKLCIQKRQGRSILQNFPFNTRNNNLAIRLEGHNVLSNHNITGLSPFCWTTNAFELEHMVGTPFLQGWKSPFKNGWSISYLARITHNLLILIFCFSTYLCFP